MIEENDYIIYSYAQWINTEEEDLNVKSLFS